MNQTRLGIENVREYQEEMSLKKNNEKTK